MYDFLIWFGTFLYDWALYKKAYRYLLRLNVLSVTIPPVLIKECSEPGYLDHYFSVGRSVCVLRPVDADWVNFVVESLITQVEAEVLPAENVFNRKARKRYIKEILHNIDKSKSLIDIYFFIFYLSPLVLAILNQKIRK